MTDHQEPFQWWGPALFVAVRAIARRRDDDSLRHRERARAIDSIVMQARYLHALRGSWPTAIAVPFAPPTEYVRVHNYPRVAWTFSESEPMESKFEVRDIRVREVRNSDGFWAATFAGAVDPVMFWPAPREAPEWWKAR